MDGRAFKSQLGFETEPKIPVTRGRVAIDSVAYFTSNGRGTVYVN